MNDWDDVRFFLAVARAGNITAASRALSVNHSTVSRRIKALEERHGVRLFDQMASGYKLTDEASEVYELALDIEAQNHAFSRKLQGMDSLLSGAVNATMPHDLFEFFLVKWLPEFHLAYPEIEINMMVAKGLKDLGAREADIAVRLTDNPPDYLVGKRICDLHYGLYSSKHLAAPRQGGSPVIVWSDQEGLPDWAKTELDDPYVSLRVNDLLAMYKAVEVGLGIARMPVYMHNFYRSPDVELLPVTLPTSRWGVWVLSHVDLRNTQRVQTFRAFLLKTFTEHARLFTEK